MRIEHLIPGFIRLQIRLLCRFIQDRKAGVIFAGKQNAAPFNFLLKEKQTIRKGDFYRNKIDNIKLACNLLKGITIESGETLSFWRIVGRPLKIRGFKIGRNLKDGKIKADIGGGLCQLSGIIYYVSLKAGLLVTERYNHSTDIYKEEERFAPLGSDATVVYGYKDLRIKNAYPFPVKFDFEIGEDFITCFLLSREEIKSNPVEFIRNETREHILVETMQNNVLLTTSVYSKPSF